MRVILFFLLLSLSHQACCAPLPSFRERYNLAAIDMVPAMQISKCETKSGADQTKGIIECTLKMPNALLTLDTKNGKLSGVWLMYDQSALEHPADLSRVGGMLLRAIRGISPAGDHVAVASDLFKNASQNGWKETCKVDLGSQSNYCVNSSKKNIFNLTLTPTNE